ncbi:MAG: carbohydrate ABC transporter permease [Ruminiclostridium sp.]|nr:carbohydrate ABC transporter permease [Ruminiclostridium sp.]
MKTGKLRTVVFGIVSVIWLIPAVLAVMNSFKTNEAINTDLFALPGAGTFAADNYAAALTYGDYPFFASFAYSVVISVLSTSLIIVCCSMAAWYIVRVDSVFSRIFFGMCIFSLAVPFQMVMFTLSSTAYTIGLDTPWTIPLVYLGYGAGMSIFMFTGFIRDLPFEIEEAANLDGCGPVRTFFLIVFPMLRPVSVSVGILQLMWVWNDYLLPYLVLDITEYRTIPIHVQYLKGSYGSVDLGASLAVIVMALLPIMVVYAFCQKYIVKGMTAGAVKG